MKIGWFSTDFNSAPMVDEVKSALAGTVVHKPGQSTVSYGGTYLQRGAMPAMELTKHGYECIISWRFRQESDGSLSVMDKDGVWHDDLDIFWSQRWMSKDAPEQMRRARAAGQIVAADCDDGFWNLTSTNIAYHTTDPKTNPDFNRDHYKTMLAECDFVTVSTEALRRDMERLGVPTFIVRNAVDMERWQQQDPGVDGMIGWIGGIQWRAHDLAILRAVGLPQFLRDYDLPVYHGGDSDVPGVPKFWDQVGIDPQQTKCVVSKLSHVALYPRMWQPLNVSLVPLEQVGFNQRKSFLKSLESCAAGLPYIVSAGFSEQQILVDEGSAGRVARNSQPKDWRRHLEELLDPDVRRAEGAINRAVAKKHDIHDRWIEWDDVFKQFVKEPSITH